MAGPARLADVSNHAQIVVASRLATDLHGHADEIRRRRATLAAAAGQIRWKSIATVLFMQRLSKTLDALDHCATQFDAAADTIFRMAVAS